MLRRITRLIAGLLATGLLLALAPSASATTTYDITQVGDASWVGITDSNENDATKTPLASNGANVRVTFGVHIEDMSRLAEGDTVTVPFGAASGSHYGLGLFGSANLPRVLRNRDGVDTFTLTAERLHADDDPHVRHSRRLVRWKRHRRHATVVVESIGDFLNVDGWQQSFDHVLQPETRLESMHAEQRHVQPGSIQLVDRLVSVYAELPDDDHSCQERRHIQHRNG